MNMLETIEVPSEFGIDDLRMKQTVAPPTMQAVVYDAYGGADRLHTREISTPVRLPGSVLIRVHAAGVNPIDYRLRRGEAKWILPGGFPRVPGYDVAGEIAEGDPEAGLQSGDRVLGFLGSPYGGAYAQYARCAIAGVAKIPANLSFEQAAAIPLAGSTALQSLRDKGEITPGDRVLINGASGGVGAFAVQIAKAYGAQVTAVCSAKHAEFVRSIGADDFIDYQQQSFSQLGRTWDLVFDAAGKSSFWKARRALTRDGRYVSTEPNLVGALTGIVSKLLTRRSSVMLARPRASDLAELVSLHQAGKLSVTLAGVLPLDQAAQAHQQLESGGHCGKFVLKIDHDAERQF